MPRPSSQRLAPAEWKVMKIIWKQKRCTARVVCEAAGHEHGWAVSTVKTILRRLVEKGYLKTTLFGNCFLYRPARPALKSLTRAADTLLENAIEGTVGPLLAHMLKKSDLSAEDLAELRSLLDKVSPSGE